MNMTQQTKTPQTYRSRLFNLVLLMMATVSLMALKGLTGIGSAEKLILAYVFWGAMIFLLFGLFSVRTPSARMAFFAGIAAFGAELGRFNPTALGHMADEMLIFTVVTMILGLGLYFIGIGVGWMVEKLFRRIFQIVDPLANGQKWQNAY